MAEEASSEAGTGEAGIGRRANLSGVLVWSETKGWKRVFATVWN